jgi:hypothetical protein
VEAALIANVLSGLALLTSACSLLVSIISYRSAGPRVVIAKHSFSIRQDELWLAVRLANTGKGEIDLDGATCDLLGPTVTALPYRLKAAASHELFFRATLSQSLARTGSVTVNVGFGNGRSLVAQVRLTDQEQSDVSLCMPSQVAERFWLPPTQDEV